MRGYTPKKVCGANVYAPPCDVWLDDADHVDRGLVELDEDGVVDLPEAEQLQDLLHLGCHGIDTLDADEEGNLGLWLNVEVAALACLALEADDIALGASVLLHVRLGTLEILASACLLGLWREVVSGRTSQTIVSLTY